MNIYAKIRMIENPIEFKRLVNTILGAEHGENYQPTKEWNDYGVDGYHKKDKTVYAVYCPTYPERTHQHQYRDKISSDIRKLKNVITEKKLKLNVKR